jgi:hypothetical protein
LFVQGRQAGQGKGRARLRRSSVGSYRERIAQKVEAAQAVLEREVAALVSGEDWLRYLTVQARLHAYSANNVLLIAAQHAMAFTDGLVNAPEPSVVAGFNTWKALGRWVNKGQRGYAVLAPMQRMQRIAVDQTGSVRRLGRGEAPANGEIEQQREMLRGFMVEYVFDVSQTSGAEVPVAPMPRLLRGEAPVGLRAAVTRFVEDRGFSVETVPDAAVLGGANGMTRWDDRTVMVRRDMDDAAQVKTLIHDPTCCSTRALQASTCRGR